MKKIRSIFIYFLNLPIWLLSKIIIPNKSIWIFGAWFGNKYADNSKYLFEYVNNNCKDINAIWLSNDNNTIQLIREKGYRAYKSYSFKGYYYSFIAKYAFVSTGFTDINFFPTSNTKIINLWHGIPLKKIMKDDDITGNLNKQTSLYYKLKEFFFPFAKERYYSVISTSEEITKIYKSAFRGLTNNVNLIGQTRCDSFYLPVVKTPFIEKLTDIKENGKNLIIYMPTHRREGKINFSEFLINELNTINNVMKINNSIFLIKLHYYHQRDIESSGIKYSNIIFVNDEDIQQDIYSMLTLTDVLITDYSSIYFDYLHLNKPIIFYPFDKEDYLANDRAFYFDYDSVTPGEKAYNWNELYKKLEKILNNNDDFRENRKIIHNRFNVYQDGHNCERLVEWIGMLEDEQNE